MQRREICSCRFCKEEIRLRVLEWSLRKVKDIYKEIVEYMASQKNSGINEMFGTREVADAVGYDISDSPASGGSSGAWCCRKRAYNHAAHKYGPASGRHAPAEPVKQIGFADYPQCVPVV